MNTKKYDVMRISLAVGFILSVFLLAYLPRNDADKGTPSGISGLSYLEDPSGTLTLDDMGARQGQFAAVATSTVFRQRTTAACWIKFTLDDIPAGADPRFLEIANPNLEDIRIWFPGNGEILLGKKMPVKNLEVKSRIWHVRIPEISGADLTVYMRVKTNTNMRIPLRVETMSRMVNASIFEMSAFAFFFGILIAVLFVNIFSFFLLENGNFGIYIVYLLSLIVYHLRVHGILWFIPMPFAIYDAIVWISLGAMGICMMKFAQRFLDLRKNMPIMNSFLDAGIVLFVIQTLTGLFISSYYAGQIAYVTGFVVPLAIIASTVRLFITGHRETRFYLIAWCALFSGTLVWSTAAWLESRISPSYFFLLGTSADTILFTLAIFDQLKKELLEKDDLARREKYYLNLSRTDTLTGLYNRQYLNELVKRLENDNELPSETSMIMIDLDNFKSVNDNYGHLVGDMLLTRTGTKIKKHIRKSDIACRYGGDEFLIFLPGADGVIADRIAEAIRMDLLNDISYSETGEEIHITTSIGITESRVEDSFDGMFLRADAALYQAKKTGRNKIASL